ncbi:Uncharacterised protein [Shigella flexneri]|nr:Uncharacterised protein [Shigella flexneri]
MRCSVGDIVEFQVKKDIKTTLLKFAHKLWPKQCKHLFTDLQTTIAWVDLVDKGQRVITIMIIKGNNHRRIRNSAGRR